MWTNKRLEKEEDSCKEHRLLHNKKQTEDHVSERQGMLQVGQHGTQGIQEGAILSSLYYLYMRDIPEMNMSTMQRCLNQVCSRDNGGAKTKDGC